MTTDPGRPARMRWLGGPVGRRLRPPEPITVANERLLFLVGAAMFIAGYDLNLLGLAMPQIQAELGIPADQAGPTIALVRLGMIPALVLAMFADVLGRRRLLMITVLGMAVSTVLSGFAQTREQFILFQALARVFGYAEEMLCIVVLAEEFSERTRGWAVGALGALISLGGGFAAIVFAFVDYLPGGWRALYVLGAVPLLWLAWARRALPETQRFSAYQATRAGFSLSEALRPAWSLLTHYPGRLAMLAATIAPFAFGIASATVLMPTYLQTERGFSPGDVTILFLTGGAVAVLGNLVAGRLSDIVGRRVVLITAMVLATLGFIGFYQATTVWQIAPAWIVALFSFFAAEVILAAYGAELFPTSYRSTSSAVRLMISMLAGATGLMVEGSLFSALGSHADAVALLALVAPAGAVVAFVFLPESAQRDLDEIAPER